MDVDVVPPENSQQHNNLPHLVLLRGLIRSRFHWEQFPQQLQSAFPDHPILTPELAGNGERYREKTPFSVAAMVEDIRQQITDTRRNQQPVIIIAVSMGAMIASEWARRYPQEIDQLHLINTSFSNLSLPWQRMQAPAFFSLVSRLFDRQKLEREIIRWTINTDQGAELEKRWQHFAVTHPLSHRNAITQLLSASSYRGPLKAPLNNAFFYCSRHDQLVNSHCTRQIAHQWQKPLLIHQSAGHDLSMDDPQWLIHNIQSNIHGLADKGISKTG